MERYVWIAMVIIAANLVAFSARGEASLSDIQSGMINEVITAQVQEAFEAIQPNLNNVQIGLAVLPISRKYVGEGYKEPFLCGSGDYIIAPRVPRIDYLLIFKGKLSGHSAFSPYARFASNDYWQVVYSK
ncbi:hypothetical protein [Shewanella sedimentimangrovi]|uniref:Uncharacterized protein n=1 Tax=Shewanella sedimentimangrovi TaxID=2814293 RepID=A0ABX7QZP3_9GAMM|nr:hypothetical protein [Shewanella sedimentimangrovi]QSX37017.1 hypothetical protein JYB85_17435 [Shewanella sedimentimangrovi]